MNALPFKIDGYEPNELCSWVISELYRICHDGTRFIPKRNLNWIKKNHTDLYSTITANTEKTKIGEVLVMAASNWEHRKCVVCHKPVIVKGQTVFDVCSNRCAIKKPEVQLRTSQTCKEKYGKRFNVVREKYKLGDHHLQKNMKNIDAVNDQETMKILQSSGDWTKVADYFGLTKNSHSASHKFMRRMGYPLQTLNCKSIKEIEVADYVASLIGENNIVRNCKQIITPYELDVYIPNKKLAIEFNGVYYHSSGAKEDDAYAKDRHLIKTQLCEEKGVQLLHIFEYEWDENKDIWQSVIKSKLGLTEKIYARKTKLVNITPRQAKEFCIKNHLQGYASSSINRGLIDENGDLIMVATFAKPRYNSNYALELIRLCTKIGYTVVGGASKITKGLNFISYANRRWSNGKVYKALGMNLVSVTEPCYWYTFKGRLYHRSSFMKYKLQNKLAKFDPSKTEVENCYENGFRRIWDCGNYLFAK